MSVIDITCFPFEYNKAGNYMKQMRKWFVLGAIIVAVVLFAIAITTNNGVAAIVALILLALSLVSKYFMR